MNRRTDADYTALGKPVLSSALFHTSPKEHSQRVMEDLRRLGVRKWAMSTMEAKYLPSIIHKNEILGGLVYGLHEDGFAMLVATDRRVIFLDLKPLFKNEDDINYYMVSGVTFGHTGPGTTVTLHTRVRDYTITTLNYQCAERFVRCIDHHIEHEKVNGFTHETTASFRG